MPDAPMPSPERIFDALTAFQQTELLKSALGFDVFTRVGASGSATAQALAEQCQTAVRGMRILCDALAVVGFLGKEQDRYRLTPESAVFLDRKGPAYMGAVANFLADEVQIAQFRQLSEAVRRGGSPEASPAMQPDSPYWVSFARNLAGMQRFPARSLAELLLPKPQGPCKVLDVAAGHGLFGIALAERNPEAEIYALDWPRVLEVAAENAAAAGVGDRYHLLPGGAFDTGLGQGYDWVLLTNFLHHFDAPTCEAFLKRVRTALNPQGEIALLEFVVNDDGLTPPGAALFSLIMLSSTPAGQAYTYSEFEAMLQHAGFNQIELHPLPPSFQRVIIAGA